MSDISTPIPPTATEASHGNYQKLIEAARRVVSAEQNAMFPRDRFPLQHNLPMHEKATSRHAISSLDEALKELGA